MTLIISYPDYIKTIHDVIWVRSGENGVPGMSYERPNEVVHLGPKDYLWWSATDKESYK